MKAILFLIEVASVFIYIQYTATPMSRNKVVHTGPKTQFGGLNKGFSKEAYQPSMAGAVKIEPIRPANSDMTTNLIIKTIFLIFIIIL